MTEPTGTKPVLAEIPADFSQLTGEQQDRFVADLAAQLLGTLPEGRRPYRPEDDQEEEVMMTVDYDELTSIYAEIMNGVGKEESRFADLPGFSEAWDRAVAEIERIRREHPDMNIDLPL